MAFDYANYMLLIFAAVLILSAVKGIVTHWRARGWAKVQGTIKALAEAYDEKTIFYATIKYFFPAVRYEYEYNGRKYLSDKVAIDKEDIWVPEVNLWGDRIREDEKFWRSWQLGTSVSVYVNPQHPDQSVLIKQVSRQRRSHYLALLIGGLFCLVVFFVLELT